jgi:hypothetical protein
VERPIGETGTGRGQTTHGSLIQPRTDFIKEIVASAEDL